MKQIKLLTILGILSSLAIPAAAQIGQDLIKGGGKAVEIFTGTGKVTTGLYTNVQRSVEGVVTGAHNVYTRHPYVGPGSILPPITDALSATNPLSRFTSAEDRMLLEQAQQETVYRLIFKHKYNDRLPAGLQGTLSPTVQSLYQSPEALIDYLMQYNVSADALLTDVAIQYTTQSFPDKTISPQYFNAINEQLLTLLLTKYKANPNVLYNEQPLFFQFIDGAMNEASPAKAKANQTAFQLCYENGADLSLQGNKGTGWHALIKTWPLAKYTAYLKDLKAPNSILDRGGNSLLHAMAGLPDTNWQKLRTLIDLGLNPTLRNHEGKTAADIVYPLGRTPLNGNSVAQYECRQRLVTAETVWEHNHPNE